MKTEWPTKKLGEVCEVNPKKTEVGNFNDDTIISFVPMSSVSESTQSIVAQEDKELREVKKGYTYFKKGDVLFAKITPCMENGKVALSDNLSHDIGFASTEFYILRSGQEIDSKYVFNIVASTKFREEAEAKMTGSAGQKRVPKDFLEEYEIPLPPLSEQKKIVKILEEKLGKVKEAIQLRQDAVADTEKILSAKLNEIFEEGKKQGWEEKSFSDRKMLEMTSGGTPSRSNKNYYHGNTVWLKSGELKDNRNIIDSEEKISKEAVKKSSAKIFPVGSVLFAMYGATAGKIGVLGVEASTNQAVAALIPVEDVLSSNFLYYFLMKKRIEIIEKAWGGAQPNLSQTILKKFSIPLPDLKTQEKIVKELDELSARITELRALQQEQLQDLKSLERAYLHEAFSGELVQEEKAIAKQPIPSPYFRNQVNAAILEQVNKDGGDTTEVAVAKYNHLLQELFDVPLEYVYATHKFGPFDAQIKKFLKSGLGKKNRWFAKSSGRIVFGGNIRALTSKPSNLYKKAHAAMKQMAQLGITKLDTNRVELLSTICHSIKETGSTDLEKIRDFMSSWKTDKDRTKAQKFTEEQTKKCLDFILKNGFDKKLVGKQV